MSSELLLRVTADPAGFKLLADEFQKLQASVGSVTSTLQAKTNAVGTTAAAAGKDFAKYKGELAEAAAAVRTLGAENEALAAKLDRVKASRKGLSDTERTAQAEFRAEQREVQMLLDQSIKQNVKLGDVKQKGVADTIKASQVEAEASRRREASLVTEMGLLRQKRAIEEANAVRSLSTGANSAESAVTLRMVNNQIAETTKQKRAAAVAEDLQYAAQEKSFRQMTASFDTTRKLGDATNLATKNTTKFTEAQREAHSAVRGLAGGLNLLWTTYGSTVPIVAGFAISAGIKTAIKDMAEFKRQIAFVGAITEKPGEAQAAAPQLLKLSRNSLYDANEQASALRELAQAGLSAQQGLAALPAILDLATIGEMKLSDAAFSAVAIMNTFGRETKGVGSVVDELSKAATLSTTSVQSITESVKQASVIGDQYNISLEETLTGLTLLADRGIRGTAAGTALRNMVVELYSATGKAAGILDTLGVKAFDAAGKTRPLFDVMSDLRKGMEKFDKASQLQLIQGIFNERSAKSASAILDELNKVPGTMAKISDSAGFASGATKQLRETLSGEWTQAINNLKASLIEVASTSEGPLLEAVKNLKAAFASEEFKRFAASILEGFANVVSWMSKNGDTIVTFIEALLMYKAGKSLVPAALGGFDAIKTAITGVASAAATAGGAGLAAKGGLIGLALFGGWELGGMLYNIDIVGKAVRLALDPIFERQSGIDAVWSKLTSRPGPRGGLGGDGTSAMEQEIRAAAARNAQSTRLTPEQEAAALRSFRQSEIAGYKAPRASAPGMAVGSAKYDAGAEKAAGFQLQDEIARYKALETANKAHTDTQLAITRAYHSAHLLTEAQFMAKESQIIDTGYNSEQKSLGEHIKRLQTLRLTVSPERRLELDREIDRAQQQFAANQEKRDQQRLSDLSKIVGKETEAAQKAIESANDKNAELGNQIAVLRNLEPLEKNTTAAALDKAIAHAQVAVKAREAAMATLELAYAEGKVMELGDDYRMNRSAREKLLEEIAALKKAKETNAAFIKEKKELENSWQVGAVQGLKEYLNTTISTVDIMKDVFKKGFGAMEQTIFEFAKTGKLNVKDMLTSITDDVLRAMIKMNITQPLAQMFQGFLTGQGGGFNLGSLTSLFGGGSGGGGGLLSTVGSLFGGSGYTESAIGTGAGGGGFSGLIGDAGGSAAAGGGSSLSALSAGLMKIPVWGWIGAAIVAGMAKSDKLYSQGYTGASVMNQAGPNILAAIHAPGAFQVDKLFQRMGMSGRAAGILTGTPILARISAALGMGGENWKAQLGFGNNAQAYANTGGLFGSEGFSQIAGKDENNRGIQDWMAKASKHFDEKLASYLTKAQISSISNTLQGAAQREFAFSGRDGSSGEQLSKEYLQQKYGTIFDEIDKAFAKSIREFEGSGDDLAKEIDGFIKFMDAVRKLNIKGLDMAVVHGFQQEGETITETLDRLVAQFKEFDSAFQSPIQQLLAQQKEVKAAFADLEMAVPISTQAYYDQVHALDLSTEAGRNAFTVLMQVAPAFLNVQNAAAGMITNFNSLMGQIQGPQFSKGVLEGDLRSQAEDWLKLAAGSGWTVDQVIAKLPNMSRSDFNWVGDQYGLEGQQKINDMLATYAQLQQANQSLTSASVQTAAAVTSVGTSLGQLNAEIEKWARSKLLSADSPLLPAEQLNVAMAQYQKTVGMRDRENFTTDADALLAQGREYYGSGEDYTALFNRVMADSEALGGFKLNYQSSVAAGSIDAMRSDLLVEMRLAREQNSQLSAEVAALLKSIQDKGDKQIEAIIESAETMARTVEAAVASANRK